MPNVIKTDKFHRRVLDNGYQDILRYLEWAQREGEDTLCINMIRCIYQRFDMENSQENNPNACDVHNEFEFKPAYD